MRHPPLQKPTRLLRFAPRAQEGSKEGSKEGLRCRSGCLLKVADFTVFDHAGLLTIWHFVHTQPQQPPLLLGFDFFKEIDGKIHYMEDNCKANHHASQEEHCCMDLCQAGRLGFLV